MTTLVEQTRELWERDELPEGLRWIGDLTPLHQRFFYGDLQYQWGRYCASQDAKSLLEFLEDWQATAEVDRNPELAAYLLNSEDQGEFEEWKAAS